MSHTDIGQSTNYSRLEQIVGNGDRAHDLQMDPTTNDKLCNRRSWYRCPVQLEEQQGTLGQSGNERQYEVRLTDRSAGGFAVAISGAARFREGQVLSLQTSSAAYEVEVVHVGRKKNETRVGLKQLREIPKAQATSEPAAAPEVMGSLTVGTLFLIVVFLSVIFFRFALRL